VEKKNKVAINKDFFGQLNRELNNLKNDIGNHVAEEAKHRLSAVANKAIKDFYDDYIPRNYSRHYQFETKAFRPYRNTNISSGKYYGGIRLTPELFDDVYEIDTYKVYGMVMGCVIDNSVTDNPDIDFDSIEALGGYHGPFSIFNNDPPPTRPDPISQIFDELENIYLEQDILIKDAIAQSKIKRKYKLIDF